MLLYSLLLILDEGLIFGIFAIGIYVAFQWLRFPDLTPDGTFVLGATVYTKAVTSGVDIWTSLLLAILVGMCGGFMTAALNRIAKIPTVVAGLLVAISLYSVSWLILGKPNQYLNPTNTLAGNATGFHWALVVFCYVLAFSVIVVILLALYSNTIWGFRIRAIGENALLAKDFKTRESIYTFIGLGLTNAIVAFSGALFAQRSYSADVNMGVGQTIIALIAMIIGLILASRSRKTGVILLAIMVGSVLHRAIIFITLQVGIPAESFKLVSALFFVALFISIKATGSDFLEKLKWS